jgi:hypothetical protein
MNDIPGYLIAQCRLGAVVIVRTVLNFLYSESTDVIFNPSKASVSIFLEMATATIVF